MESDVKKENKRYLAYEQCYDAILKHYGPVDAVVFGIIHNKSKLSHGCCQYSEVQIGDMMHVSWFTVSESLKRLIKYKLIVLVPHYEKTSKLNKTRWYKPADGFLKKLKFLSDTEPEKVKSNSGRIKDQEFNKKKLFENGESGKTIQKIGLFESADDRKTIIKNNLMIEILSGNDDLMIEKLSLDTYKNYPKKVFKQELNKQESTINTFSKTGKASGFIESGKQSWDLILKDFYATTELCEYAQSLSTYLTKTFNPLEYKSTIVGLLPKSQYNLDMSKMGQKLNTKLIELAKSQN